MRHSIIRCTSALLLAPNRQVDHLEPSGGSRPGDEPPRPTGHRYGRALRVDGRLVESAMWTLTHPDTGRTVTLVGAMHIGDAEYFRNVSGELARLSENGAEIHVEGINHDRAGPMTEWERARLAEADRWANAETSGAAVALLRLESQGAKLRLPEGARNIDFSDLDLLRRVGWDNYRRLLSPEPETRPMPGIGPVVRAAIRFQLRHSGWLAGIERMGRRSRRVNHVVIGERNQVAFAGAVDALTRGDVALVWGSDHLPGLARLFAGVGYRLRAEHWFHACTI